MSDTHPDFKDHVQRAIDYAGGVPELARGVKRSRALIYKLISRKEGGANTISTAVAQAIHDFTDGKVGKHDLRPDIWQAPKKAAA